jgi:hypothetical protein
MEIRRIVGEGHHRKDVYETPYQPKKLSMVVHTYHPNYVER